MQQDEYSVQLTVPTTELALVIGVKRVIARKIEDDCKCTIAVRHIENGSPNKHLEKSSVLTVIGSSHKSLNKSVLKLSELFCKSKIIHKVDIDEDIANEMNEWSEDRVLHFQHKNAVFLEFTDLGDVSMKAWQKSRLVLAQKKLKEQCGSSDAKRQLVLSATIEVSGRVKLEKELIDKLVKKTNSSIFEVTRGDKDNRTTIITVSSPNEKDQKKAVDTITAKIKTGKIRSIRYRSSKSESESSVSSVDEKMAVLSLSDDEFVTSEENLEHRPEENKDEQEKVEEPKIKYPSHMNILVLGETGVGKSTFINGLVNYAQYDSIQEALDGGVHILIKSSFTLTDDDFNPHEIVCEPTVDEEQHSTGNEHLGRGQSATQDPKSYVFKWSDEGEEKSIRIIDTPGIGDTRGIEQDKINFDKILSFIADFSEIHAVCILVKPNSARLTHAFRFCIDELLVHLHKSASKNILFCFTNTRGTLYKPGDSHRTLKEHLDSLRQKRDIEIPLNKSSIFCFDNESFRFLCAVKNGVNFPEEDSANFEASWGKSVLEADRLFARVSELPTHCVEDTLCLNNTRRIILTLARPLAEITKNQKINVALIEDKLVEIENHLKEGDDLKGKLLMEQVVIRAEEIDHPRTVCTADKCVEHRRFNGDPNAPLQTVYKSICHDNCGVRGVQAENCPNTRLQHCSAMRPTGGQTCVICGCLWSTHMHIRYVLNHTMEKIVDPTVEESIARKDDMVKSANIFVEAARKKVEELKEESEKITKYCAEFASFLAGNSIIPYNDSYRQYIEHLIREEQDKVAGGGSDSLLRQMEGHKAEYEEQVTMLKASMASEASSDEKNPRQIRDIDEMVKELKQLKHAGSVLEEIQKLELHKVRQTQQHLGKIVLLKENKGFFRSPSHLYNTYKKRFFRH